MSAQGFASALSDANKQLATIGSLSPTTAEKAAYARLHTAYNVEVANLQQAQTEIVDGNPPGAAATLQSTQGKLDALTRDVSTIVTSSKPEEAQVLAAVAAALMLFAVAGEVAATRARGPGSFAMEIVDALYGLDQATLRERGRVT